MITESLLTSKKCVLCAMVICTIDLNCDVLHVKGQMCPFESDGLGLMHAIKEMNYKLFGVHWSKLVLHSIMFNSKEI